MRHERAGEKVRKSGRFLFEDGANQSFRLYGLHDETLSVERKRDNKERYKREWYKDTRKSIKQLVTHCTGVI